MAEDGTFFNRHNVRQSIRPGGPLYLRLLHPDLVKSAAANLDLVKATVSNPEVARILSEADAGEIQEIRDELDKKKRQIEIRNRNNNFGHAVQEAVKKAVEALGLRLELVDWGYDYEVFPDGASFTFEVGSYFLEVKATTTRDVRLTPTQANKAWHEPNRFVLCVVDLYGQQIKEAWEPADIVPWARIVTKIGGEFEEIHKSVTSFSDTAKPVHLRNEELLRYGVSVDLWSQGVSIAELAPFIVRITMNGANSCQPGHNGRDSSRMGRHRLF